MVTVTIGRDRLSLSDLAIDGNPATGAFHIPEADVKWPRLSMRKVYAPESEFIGGRVKLAQVPGVSDYTLPIYAHGASTALVGAAQDILEAAVTQFDFSLTIDVDGESRTYLAEGDFPDWGEVDPGLVAAFMVRGTVAFNLLGRVA